ncbi:hypothetical protein Tco_1480683, partial [Tanacetum coccineum]
NGTVRPKTYEELSDKEKLQADCDLKATNIVLQGLPPDVYALVNHHKVAKDIWDRVKMLMQGTSLSNRATVQQVQGRQGQNVVGSGSQGNASGSKGNTSGQVKVIKCYNCQEGKELDEEQLTFLADPIVANAKAVLMANLSSCDSNVLFEVPYSDTSQNNMMNQSVHEFQYSELLPIFDYLNIKITSYSNIIPYSQYLEETQQPIVQNTNTSTQQNSMLLSMFEQMSNHATNWNKDNNESKIVDESLTAKLERYKERVKILEQRFNVDLSGREKVY